MKAGLVSNQWHQRVKVTMSSCAFLPVKELITQRQLTLASVPEKKNHSVKTELFYTPNYPTYSKLSSVQTSLNPTHHIDIFLNLYYTCLCELKPLQKIKTFFDIVDLGLLPSLPFSAFTHKHVSILPSGPRQWNEIFFTSWQHIWWKI